MKIKWILLLFPILSFTQEINFTQTQAKKLLELPLHCVQTEFPNKLGQTLASASELGTPQELHPAFYGCFDWHSAVHGYWTIVNILQQYPELDSDNTIKNQLIQSLSQENMTKEIEYFNRKQEYSYERAYGWAWLFKLQEFLNAWDTTVGKQLAQNLQPLTDVITDRFINYIQKLRYPIRVGTHTNTAFALSLIYDYAESAQHKELKTTISNRAKDFYMLDADCPISWEPSGYDFLSPCFQELDIMRKVLPENEFKIWVAQFLPSLLDKDFNIEVGEVSDRNDGHMVHLDGLNFSRAWVFFDLAKNYPDFEHLKSLAIKHFNYSYPSLVGDGYEGSHWLGTFALYAIQKSNHK